MSVTEGKGSRQVCGTRSGTEVLEDTCQEHRGGARNCTRYDTDRTKYLTVPSYTYLQATPYQIRRSLKTSLTPIELPGNILYTQNMRRWIRWIRSTKGLGPVQFPDKPDPQHIP